MVMMVVSASPIVLGLGSVALDRLRPYFIPQAEIDRLAEDCIAHFGARALREIEIEADRAERMGEIAQSGVLLRVRDAIARRRPPLRVVTG